MAEPTRLASEPGPAPDDVSRLLSIGGVNRTARSQDLLERILDASTELFRKKGFLGTTTSEIADAVGIIKGTLYYHIGNKEDLLFLIHHRVTEEGIRRWTPIVAREADDTRQVLTDMITEHCRVMHEHRDAVAVFSEEMKFLPDHLLEYVRERRRVYGRLLETVVARGAARGELRVADVPVQSMVLLGMLNSIYRWYSPTGPLSPEELAGTLTELVVQGIAAPAVPAVPAAPRRSRRPGSRP